MTLHAVDIGIIVGYFLLAVGIGLWAATRRKAQDLDSYFPGGKTLPWYLLGVSNASGMFDITGTMWLVYICFAYGLKSVWLPWLWPTFNQIFLMVYVSMWLRRSNVLTGAEWIQTRFDRGTGANLAHLSVALFALVNVVGMLAYDFKGIGKFATIMLPWDLPGAHDENLYSLGILSLTVVYVIKGGMFSVVITEVLQFVIMTIAAVAVGVIAMSQVSPGMIEGAIPDGWTNLFFGWHVGLDWTGILVTVNDAIREDGNELFGIVFGLMIFKGVLASMAGPAPHYDMQRILATRITSVVMWIVGALYGGYVAANVLKWHWWRFNGHGYFWGMLAGMLSAMCVPMITEAILGHRVNPLFVFPIILLLSVAGCILGTLLTRPEDDAVLKAFYRNVRSWGFGGSIRAKVQQEDPACLPNRDFGRDATNVIVGIVWQLTLTALPIYILLREWSWSSGVWVVLLVTTAILKFNWYDKLPREQANPTPAPA